MSDLIYYINVLTLIVGVLIFWVLYKQWLVQVQILLYTELNCIQGELNTLKGRVNGPNYLEEAQRRVKLERIISRLCSELETNAKRMGR